MALYLTFAGLLYYAQSGDSKLEFEVASVKAHGPWNGVMSKLSGGPGTSDPGRMIYSNWSLRMLVARAYGTKGLYRLATPSWMANEFYTIEAKLPANASQADAAAMLQALLAERFQLATHHESREMVGYALVVANGGIKMTPAAPGSGEPAAGNDGAPQNLQMNRDGWTELPPGRPAAIIGGYHGLLHMTARDQGSEYLRDFLEGYLKKPVVDETGLTGAYDFKLEYAREDESAAGAPAARKGGKNGEDIPAGSGLPLVGAIQKQLGLKVVSKKVTINVLVVDRAEKTPIHQ